MTAPNVSHSRHVVLVVYDAAQIARTLGDILSRDGLDVLTAPDAKQALVLLENNLPNVILLDVEMPGMNGYELCRRIKQSSRWAHVPVVMVTAKVGESDVAEGIAAGALDYIKKPFDRDDVRMRVRLQIRLNEALAEKQRVHRQLAVISATARSAIIMLDSEGKVLHWNEAAERIFGYARDEVLGQDLPMLIAPIRFHEACGKALLSFQATGERAAVGTTVELAALRKSGEEFPIELSIGAAKFDDKWCAVGIIHDITNRKRMENQRTESEEKHRCLFESSRDPIMTLEPPNWLFTSGNQATLAMFRAKEVAEFTSRSPGELSPKRQRDGRESADAAKERIEAAMHEGSAFFEWTHKRMDGEEFPAMVLLARMDWGGKQFLQATARDISEQKQLEIQLLHAQKPEAVGQFAAGIAHEINTPMQYVGDDTHFLQEAFGDLCRMIETTAASCHRARAGESAEQLASSLEAAFADADWDYLKGAIPPALEQSLEGIGRVTEIVRAMKDFSHPGTGEKIATDLNGAIQVAITIARNEWKYAAEVDTDLDPTLPFVECLPGKISQVLLNLLVNAAHTIADQVGSSGQKGRITIATRADAECVQISIADTGAGMSAEVQRRIFEPFFTTKAAGKGTGQGLTIAHNVVVRHHGGRIDVRSAVGAGTTFVISLPIVAPRTSSSEPESKLSGAGREHE